MLEAMDGRKQAHMDVLVAVFGKGFCAPATIEFSGYKQRVSVERGTSPPVPEDTSGWH